MYVTPLVLSQLVVVVCVALISALSVYVTLTVLVARMVVVRAVLSSAHVAAGVCARIVLVVAVDLSCVSFLVLRLVL